MQGIKKNPERGDGNRSILAIMNGFSTLCMNKKEPRKRGRKLRQVGIYRYASRKRE